MSKIGKTFTFVSSYAYRHVRGDYSVAVAFWIGWLLASELIRRFSYFASNLFGGLAVVEFRTQAIIQAALLGVPVAAFAIGAVGAWRSASNHLSGSRGRLKRNCIKLCIITLACGGASSAADEVGPYGLVIRTIKLAAFGVPEDFPEVHFFPEERALYVSGSLVQGSAEYISHALRRESDIRTVAVRSGGGRISEALAIASAIEARGLNTLADRRCSSACVLVLLAGSERWATRRAKIGLHQSSDEGTSLVSPSGNAKLAKFYRERGVQEDLIRRMLAVPPSSMWYPSLRELARAGVLNTYVDPNDIDTESLEPAPTQLPSNAEYAIPDWATR